jgi:hypothetical protein
MQAEVDEEFSVLTLVALDRGHFERGNGGVVDKLFKGLHDEGTAALVELEEVPRGQDDEVPVQQIEKKALHLHDQLRRVAVLAAAIELVHRGHLTIVFLHLGCRCAQRS